MHFDLTLFIQAVGLLGVMAIVFAESGLLVGLFLPGDSLLFTAGFLASQGVFDITVLTIGCFMAAVLGDSVGYLTGDRFGRRLFTREDSRFFKKSYLQQAEAFYNKHGGKAIVLARFVPIVRTFTPIVAGVAHMKYHTFLFYNCIGALFWSVGITLLGYFLGSQIPDVDRYLLPILLMIVLVSISPGLIHFFREKSNRLLLKKYLLAVFKIKL